MDAYLLRLNVTANLVPYTLSIRDDCYHSSVSFSISENNVSFLYRARSPRVSVVVFRGGDVISRSFCLKRGCNRGTINLNFPPTPSSPTGTTYDFSLTDRNYGIPLDGTLNLND